MNRMNAGALLLLAALISLPVRAEDDESAADRLGFSLDDGMTVSAGPARLTVGAQLNEDMVSVSNFPGNDGKQNLLRRARPTLRLGLGSKVDLRVDYEISNAISPGIKNAWAQWKPWRPLTLRVGNQSAPFGLDAATGSQDNTFIERPAATVLAPGLLTGGQIIWRRRHSTLAVGYFGNGVNSEDRRKLQGRSALLHWSGNPLRSEHGFWHVGMSAELRQADSNAQLRIDPRPETFISLPRLVDTHTISGVDRLVTLGAEMAVQRGPAILQTEYLHSSVGSSAGQFSSLSFDGWYGSLAWMVTGERRAYSSSVGGFTSVKPRHRWGAIEIAARTGAVDLNDTPVAGGVQRISTFALNYYFREHLRLMIDYSQAESLVGGAVVAKPKLSAVRLQFTL